MTDNDLDLDAIEARRRDVENIADAILMPESVTRNAATIAALGTAAALSSADVPALVAEVRRLRALLDRIAYPALMYDARVYMLSEDAPELLDRLTPELRALVGERPSEVARRVEEERDDARAAIARVRALDPAEHATSSRDYGRGYAQALRDVNAALEKTDG